MSQIPDFTETERWTLRTALTERYGAPMDAQQADGEVRLSPESSTLTTGPVADWSVDGAQLGTGSDYYDNPGDCVTLLLQVQADHQIQKNLSADQR